MNFNDHISFIFLFSLLFSEECVFGAIDARPRVTKTNSALFYLAHYGYMDSSVLNPKTGALVTEDSVRKSIMSFQGFAGIPQTGKLDNETINMMSMPRCGNKDVVGPGVTARKKRYALQGSRWRVHDLIYLVTKYPLGLLKGEVDRDIKRAFQAWTEVTDLTFSEAVSDTAKRHIEIRFESKEHGDGDPFDGPGGTLAHAYFPIYGGDAHFDESETWTVESYKGTNLFQVAVHEFGHSLGLSHSDVSGALMAPFYRGFQPTFRLDKDDIRAIQSLYGNKTVRNPSQTTTPSGTDPDPAKTDSEDPILCKDPNIKIDVLVSMKISHSEKDIVHLFKGKNYWRLTDDGVADGYPRDISTDFEGLPGDLDAAFPWTNGRVYFFKGTEYWRFTYLTMDEGYPREISKGFRGIPNDVKASFVWGGNGKMYFFKNDNYWRFDHQKEPNVAESYPLAVQNWKGLPNGIDTALQYLNGYTYFFKDGQYWRFNDRGFIVDKADPPFPRPIGYWWLGCKKSSQISSRGMQGDTGGSTSIVGADDVADAVDAVSGHQISVDRSGSTR